MHYKLHKLRLPLKGMPYLTTIVLINTIATSMLIPIFPLYIKNFVSNDATVGYVFSLMAVLYKYDKVFGSERVVSSVTNSTFKLYFLAN